ncbi:MAG TPA: hypothetical protein QF468_09660 [Nitrospinota bacterium]|jgi:hypothetical protein|nr:hypothetical protein [Nitrospinota bacterium]|tara:strand:- start:492 stop:1040 length:549 start_codon:yes stop_codon:yes gene_type:complete
MKKLITVMIVAAALVVVGSSNNAFAANATTNQSIVSPYWQADTNSIYTFIAVAVPSIAGATSRAVSVTAVTSTGQTAATLTIDVGTVGRFFIANTNHSSINSSAITGANWISTTGKGHVVIGAAAPDGGATVATGLNFASTLSAWGAVVIPGGTGFAMEFIGDLSDTIAIGTVTAATAEVGL